MSNYYSLIMTSISLSNQNKNTIIKILDFKMKETYYNVMKYIILFFILFVSFNSAADSLFKIEVGQDYHKYSQSDLQRRVWELERAVSQLQQRIVDLERNEMNARNNNHGREDYYDRTNHHRNGLKDSWFCTIKAMGKIHTGTGITRAVASERAMNNCKDANRGDSFFCSSISCTQ